jgi:thymidylate synthase
MKTTGDIRNIFIEKYKNKDHRHIGNKVQESCTIEIQNAHFIADEDWIIRKPNYEYAQKEIEWYNSQSRNINDIPGNKVPAMWKACADKDGIINSNYGWCIFSEENGSQYDHCLNKLIDDPHTREAIMIYNRPSMWQDYNKDGMHDFMCCQNQQYFINERNGKTYVDVIVNFRSNDAVFGYCNDYIWSKYVLDKLATDLTERTGISHISGNIYWNAGSLHIYERHFKHIEKLLCIQ